ncbi:DinB family protein [Flammeovirga yaeyamensis]|uniref:DinB family protein n=1 Tax=Flammeovirga yaeyamensis TaxID=367791 RepID=A0AAX1NDF3_9BACT|nr:DinB family protein [Flammeovirga yaeyamensis]MBB3696541.1 putative damage-inducible protein DinB [Flammeovirga yaeyamensis]NMF33220.1 DinB family protein [Flammeovirga yaeyamensis]QWG05500.1 DinB family protein [Flammeovirga yaeyamensis]
MSKGNYLSEKLKEILTEGKWVTGTNVKSQILDLTLEQASRKVNGLNSICDLVYHLNYYNAGIMEAFKTNQLNIKDKYSFDAPQIINEETWKERIATFCENAEALISLVSSLSDDEIHGPFVDPKYGTLERNIDVLIEHNYYHLGQIVLIKKLITA